MMHRLRRYDVFRFAQNDVAPLRFAMMRCLPQCAVRHTSFAKRTSLGEAVIICRRQTSFKKRTFVGRQKCVFCWWSIGDSNPWPQHCQCCALPAALMPHLKTANEMYPFAVYGGERGIRTLGTVLAFTRFPVVRLRPAQPSLHDLQRIIV